MNISIGLDGLDGPEDIQQYLAAGANEFFAGFVPPAWSERFGWEVGLNRRTFGRKSQYTAGDDLKAAMDTVHAAGRPFFITLNEHDYGAARLPLVEEVVRLVDALSPDAYIVADPALLLMLQQWGIERPIHLSTGAACFNSETIRFFLDRYPVRRVVLPRKMTLTEMGTLMHAVADWDLEFEVMVIGYRCHFNDELCFSLHSGLGANLCRDFVTGEGVVSPRFPSGWKDTLEEILAAPDKQFQPGSALDRFRKGQEAAMPPPPPPLPATGGGMDARMAHVLYSNCGLCAIPMLRRLGVHAVKVPVRGDAWQKHRFLKLVRDTVDDEEGGAAACRAKIASAGFCADPASCYYQISGEKG